MTLKLDVGIVGVKTWKVPKTWQRRVFWNVTFRDNCMMAIKGKIAAVRQNSDFVLVSLAVQTPDSRQHHEHMNKGVMFLKVTQISIFGVCQVCYSMYMYRGRGGIGGTAGACSD